jgi:DNA-binding response OmpR family regulator
MKRMLLVEDDEAMRKLIRQRMGDSYEIVETGDPTEALGLALEAKPDFVVLYLMMPRFSGLELCQTLSSVSNTQQIPIFVITGRAAIDHRENCLNLGAKDFFEKPIDFDRLKKGIESALSQPTKERRSEPRIRLKVILKLIGTGKGGKQFELRTATDDVSVSGFLARCIVPVEAGAVVEVFLVNRDGESSVGKAEVRHVQWPGLAWQTCGFRFVYKSGAWIL